MNSKRISEMLLDCLYTNEELEALNLKEGAVPAGCVKVDGLTMRLGFHPERLESYREELKGMLDDLHTAFMKHTGGGWSFLNLCTDKSGVQWGEHRNCEELIMLCTGLGMARMSPRELWSVLPGQMPYVTFDKDGGYNEQENSGAPKGGPDILDPERD